MAVTASMQQTHPPSAPKPPPPRSASAARPTVRERLVQPMPADGVWGWLLPGVIALIAGLMRFDRLGVPSGYVFDETYYAKEAAEFITYGVEYNTEDQQAQFVVHPPVGKWVIALGQLMFGNDSFGWRFSVAVLGTLAVFLIARIGRRLFRSLVLGATAAVLLATDGLAFVLSRVALLDGILMFFLLAAFGALLVDRDRSRERLADLAEAGLGTSIVGPWLGLRPFRLLAGLMLGLAVATKWNGVWFIAAFGLMTVWWDVDARRLAGVPRPYVGALFRDAVPAFLSLVVVSVLAYISSWAGWFTAGDRAYHRYVGTGPGWLPEPLANLWVYHQQMLDFHRGLDRFHAYRSHPWSWIVVGRPVSMDYTGVDRGHLGCEAERCSRAILGIGTPMLWWGGVIALAALVLVWLGRRDWRAGAILVGFGAGWLPWFAFADRTQYYFYAIVMLPFTILAVTMCLGWVLGPPGASPTRRTVGAAVAGAFVLLVALNFAYLVPILTDHTIPYDEWRARIWLRSWF